MVASKRGKALSVRVSNLRVVRELKPAVIVMSVKPVD
jgi:hypothetical protein